MRSVLVDFHFFSISKLHCEKMSDDGMTEQEAAVYDRQIRLWGK